MKPRPRSAFAFALALCGLLAACGGGGGNGSPQAAPGPAGLTVTDLGDHQTLDLAWTRPAQRTDTIQVEHSIDNGPFTLLKTVGGDSSDTLLSTSGYPDGARLAFRVCGLSGGGATGYSNTATFAFWVRSPGQVQASTYLNADGTFANRISLSWSRNALRLSGVRIDRIVGGAAPSPVATLPPGTTTWSDLAPLEGTQTVYTVTNLLDTASSQAAWSNSVAVPVLAPVITSLTQSGGLYTLTWTKAGAQADQFTVAWKTGLDSTYVDSYGQAASVSGATFTATVGSLPAGFLSFRVKALKAGQEGPSAPWGYVPPPAVPGTAFTALPLTFPSASSFSLSPSGRCLAQDSALPPAKIYEVQDGTSNQRLSLLSEHRIASAAVFDASEEPHFLAWRPSATLSGQWDLLRFRREGTTWRTDTTGLTSASPTLGVLLMDPAGHLHFVAPTGTSFLHASEASGSWTQEDTGLPSGTGGPWAASLDGLGQVRIFLGVTGSGGTSAGKLALRSAGGLWSQEDIPTSIQVDRAITGDLVALPDGRLGLATVLYNHATFASECWWLERDAAGAWSPGQQLGPYPAYASGSAFLLAGTPEGSRTALILNDTLYLRDGTGTWTSGTFCPVGYKMGPLALTFSRLGKVLVLAQGGTSGYYFPQPYLLYQEQ